MVLKVDDVSGEERAGYYVQPLLKRIWAVQLDIIKVIDDICHRHNIKYYGWFGTLLGAIRHQGFIPWDDDTDLAMMREDYETFQHFAETELPEGWHMHRPNPTLIRVLNTKVISLNQEFLNKYHGCPYVTGVDIFCLDHIPQNKADEELWANLFSAVLNLYTGWDDFKDNISQAENKWEMLKKIENIMGYHFSEQCSIADQLCDLADKIAAMYWDADSDEVTFISYLCNNSDYRIPRSYFNKVIRVPFENIMLPILADYDLPCKLEYGDDYMTPKKNVMHDSIKNQVHMLEKYFKDQGQSLPAFFNMKFDE